jgi:hypothetical protein
MEPAPAARDVQSPQRIKDIKTFRSLDLTNTRITDAGVKELKAALPRCEIAR